MRMLFENGPDQPAALRFTPDRVRAAFAGHESLLDGVDLVFSDSEDTWRAQAPTAEIIVLGRHVALPQAARDGPLRWIQTMSAGVEDIAATLPDRVALTNASGIHAAKGGEFVLAAALMLNFRIPKFAHDKQHRLWRPEFGPVLAARRVTLLGTGSIGAAGAAHLRRLGASITGVNRSGQASPDFDRVVTVDRLDTVLPETDILVASAPLTPATEGLVDRRRIGLLPPGAGVAIVGRSRVFDFDALLDALKTGALSGLVSDVFDTEPLPPDDPVWTSPNLIVTPHCSVDDHATILTDCLDLLVTNVQRFKSGEPLLRLVDKAAGY